ncbi:MAG: hypothetical protein ACRD0Y_00220 [Terriglobales bacterium]
MADSGLQTSFQYLLIVLGLIVVVLAVWMAREHLVWIAIPDGIFGVGVAWLSWTDMSERSAHHAVPAVESGPAIAIPAPPSPAPAAAVEMHHEEAAPAPGAAPPAAAGEPRPGKKKKKRRR